MREMWFVYILECNDGSLYTGITNDFERRFKKHKNGNGARYTRAHAPAVLVYKERHQTRSAALKREIEIKRLSRQEKEDLIKQIRPA